MVEAGRAIAAGRRRRLARRARRRQLARLRQGDQFPPDRRRHDARLPRLRQGDAADAAVDRRCRQRPAPGSEAQSYAIISDAETHAKMACGDPGVAFRVAILDPALTVSQPRGVTAVAGYDALSHAVEAYVTTKRTPVSDLFAREAWRLLDGDTTSGCSQAPADRRGAGGDAAGRARGRHRHRTVDARRDACLREPADRPLRHDARRRDRGDAAARRALERRSVSAAATASCCEPGARPAVRLRAAARWRASARLPAAAPRAGRLAGRPARAGRGRRHAVDGDVQPAAVRPDRRLELYRNAY